MWRKTTHAHPRKTLNKRGSVTFALSLGSGVFGILLLGTWKLLDASKQQIELQLKLDHCAGTYARELRAVHNQTERSNDRISQIRAALAASSLLPPARAALQAALSVEVMLQQARLTAWKIQSIKLRTQPSCRPTRHSLVSAPIDPGWKRIDAADALGPRPMRYLGPPVLSVESRAGMRTSRARLKRSASPLSATWSATWVR